MSAGPTRHVDFHWHPGIKEPIYRFFDRPEFADAFASGRIIQIGTLSLYRQIEDPTRRDTGEGRLRYLSGTISGDSSDPRVRKVAGRSGVQLEGCQNVHLSGNVVDRTVRDTYVLCCTFSREAPATRPHGVEITDPVKFLELATRAMAEAFPVRAAVMGPVSYRDRVYRLLEADPGPPELIKPKTFSGEREVRIVWEMIPPNVPHGAVRISCPEIASHVRLLA